MWLMKTLLTSRCINQRGAGQGDSVNIPTSSIQAVRLESGDTITLTWSSSGTGPTLPEGLIRKGKLKTPRGALFWCGSILLRLNAASHLYHNQLCI